MRTIQIIAHRKAPAWWDREVESHDGIFCSTSHWGNLFQTLGIGNGHYLEIVENKKRIMLVALYETILGGGLVLGVSEYLLKIASKLPYTTTISMHLQPVILSKKLANDPEKLVKVSKEVLKYIDTYARDTKKNITSSDYICFSDIQFAKRLMRSDTDSLSLLGTSRLYLTTEDYHYKMLPSSVRNKISKASKSGIKVTFLKKNISPYLVGLESGWKTNNLAVNDKKLYTTLGELYPENIVYVVATYKGTVLAGSGLMLFGKTILEFGIYATPASKELKMPGGDLLKWEIIKYGINHNYKFIDLNMIAVSDKKDLAEKIDNINYYKLKWGGDILYGVNIHSLFKGMHVVKKIKVNLLGH